MIQRLLPFATLTVLFIVLAIASPHFLTQGNLSTVVRQTAVINIMALGMTLVIISGGIDLSVGAILALSSVMAALAMQQYNSISMGVLVGLATGAACGTVNGTLITTLRVNPFIVTLGTLGIYRGVALITAHGQTIPAPDSFSYLSSGSFLKAPFVLWVVLLCAIAMHVLLERTKIGRYAFSIGSNEAAAFYAGIPVSFHLVAVYAIAGALTGLAALIYISRSSVGEPTGGQGYELEAIAAVVIGGGSLRGGEGSVIGTLIGAYIMGLLANGSQLLGINPYLQQAIIGVAIIAAVTFDELRKRRAKT